MKTNRTLRASLTLLGAFALTAASAAAQEVHPTPMEEAPKTFEQVQMLAKDAAQHADLYAHGARNGFLSKSDGANELDAVRSDLNRMGKDIAVLNAEQQWLAPWEREALDQVKPRLRVAASDTTSAIDYFNGHTALWTIANEHMIGQISDETSKIAETVGDYLQLHSLHNREVKIEQGMSSPKAN